MKKNLFKKILLPILLITSGMVFADCPPNINDNIQKTIEAFRVKDNSPGIQVSVLCPGESSPRDFVNGSKLLNENIPIVASTLFQIGSETKSFIATLILQLEGEGRLSIEDEIGKWLPQLPAHWKNVTIKQLLNHTSGLPVYHNLEFLVTMMSNPKRQWLPEELLAFAIKQPILHEPGKGWYYNNTNYILAGMIISAVTNQSVEEEMQKRLLFPLGLLNTYYLPYAYNTHILQHIAHGYTAPLPNRPPQDITEYNMSMAGSAGAVVSNSHDIALWFKAFTRGSTLPAAQLNELKSLVDNEKGLPIIPTENRQEGWGLGVKYIHDKNGGYWLHPGQTMGYSAMMAWMVCEDIYISISVNSAFTDTYELLDQLLTLLTHSNQCQPGKNNPLLQPESNPSQRYFLG